MTVPAQRATKTDNSASEAREPSADVLQPDRPLIENGISFVRRLRMRGNPDGGRPADKAFRDWLQDDG
jgi:hypothetical protein